MDIVQNILDAAKFEVRGDLSTDQIAFLNGLRRNLAIAMARNDQADGPSRALAAFYRTLPIADPEGAAFSDQRAIRNSKHSLAVPAGDNYVI